MSADPISWLNTRGNQARFRRLVERLTGRRIDKGTTSRWARGEGDGQRMTAATEALIVLLIRNPGLGE